MGTKLSSITEKTTIVDNDEFYIKNSEAANTERRVKSTNIEKYVKTRTRTQEIWIGAEAMLPNVVNGASFASKELPTNDVMISALLFDKTVSESAQFTWTPPKNWNAGTVRAKAVWTCENGNAAETIDLDIAALALADGDDIDTAFGTPQNVTDTWQADNKKHETAFSSAITIAGSPAAGETVIFKVSRDVASDDLDTDLELVGIVLEYSINNLGTT